MLHSSRNVPMIVLQNLAKLQYKLRKCVYVLVFLNIFHISYISPSGVKWRQWKVVEQKSNSARNPMKPSVVHQHTMLLLMIWQNMTKDVFFVFFSFYFFQNEQLFHHVFHCRSDSLVGTVWCAVVHFEESMKVNENVL